jgi:hypothetical protein
VISTPDVNERLVWKTSSRLTFSYRKAVSPTRTDAGRGRLPPRSDTQRSKAYRLLLELFHPIIMSSRHMPRRLGTAEIDRGTSGGQLQQTTVRALDLQSAQVWAWIACSIWRVSRRTVNGEDGVLRKTSAAASTNAARWSSSGEVAAAGSLNESGHEADITEATGLEIKQATGLQRKGR